MDVNQFIDKEILYIEDLYDILDLKNEEILDIFSSYINKIYISNNLLNDDRINNILDIINNSDINKIYIEINNNELQFSSHNNIKYFQYILHNFLLFDNFGYFLLLILALLHFFL